MDKRKLEIKNLYDREIDIIMQALKLAIDYEESTIDAYTTEIYFDGGIYKQRVPKMDLPLIRFLRRRIKNFERVLMKMRERRKDETDRD